MRILLWSEYFPPAIGGVELHLLMYLHAMSVRGHQFLVITTRFADEVPAHEIWHGIPIYRFDFGGPVTQGDLPRWIRQQKQITQLIDEFEPDLYHVFGVGASVLSLLQIHRRTPRPTLVRIASIYDFPERELGAESIPRKLLEVADWVTTVAQAVKDQIVLHIPALATHISVLYNGHPPPTLPPTPLATPPNILFLGRLHEVKGVESAIDAFAQLHKRHPDARLTIAGDGDRRTELERQAAPLGDAVQFLGWCTHAQVHALINTATLLVLPSQREGLPNVAIEAALMARPVVATHVGGVAEVVLDGKTGILVPPHDPHALAAALARLLENPAQAHAMGEAARAWAQQQFTIDRYADDYEALYPRVVARFWATRQGDLSNA